MASLQAPRDLSRSYSWVNGEVPPKMVKKHGKHDSAWQQTMGFSKSFVFSDPWGGAVVGPRTSVEVLEDDWPMIIHDPCNIYIPCFAICICKFVCLLILHFLPMGQWVNLLAVFHVKITIAQGWCKHMIWHGTSMVGLWRSIANGAGNLRANLAVILRTPQAVEHWNFQSEALGKRQGWETKNTWEIGMGRWIVHWK